MTALSAAGQFVFDRLGPAMTSPDDDHGGVLRELVATLVSPIDLVETAVGDDGGFGVLLSPDDCPVELLPWLAQLVGVDLREVADEEIARAMVKHPPSWRAGTPQAIADAAKAHLSGSRRVDIAERTRPDRPGEDSPWHFTVTIYEDEAPDELDGLNRDIRAVTDAELQFTVIVGSGWTFGEMAASGLTFGEAARLSGARLKHIVPGTPIDEIRRMR